MSAIKIIIGGAVFQVGPKFASIDKINDVLDVIYAAGVRNIDTAQIYGSSEVNLGVTGAGSRFTIDTKAPGGFTPGSLNSKMLLDGAKESLKKLRVDKVDVFYIHAPDTSVPLENWLPGIDELHRSKLFSRFGLSNFKAEDVQKVHGYCQEKGYVLPSVYQGNYSPVARLQETVLFPTLRKLGIAFYAYSPLAGGFLTKSKEDFAGGEGKGRFTSATPVGKLYTGLYARPAYLEALQAWKELAVEAGCERAEVAYRWVAWNSALKEKFGDGIILGGSSQQQFEESLAWLEKGPLDEKTCKAIDAIWKTIEHEAPLDNYYK